MDIRSDLKDKLLELRSRQLNHPFWDNRLFHALRAGWLGYEDLSFLFGQYAHYSKNFTRLIAAVMTNCDNDLFRAQLSENLWEEGGGCEPEKRHAEIFRRFLADVFAITKPERVELEGFTRHFVREYMVFCLRANPIEASAFLSLGTEGIVSKMYQVFLEGLRKAGIDDAKLTFFHIHVECDDAHAQTLEDMMMSYENEPGWFEACLRGLEHALSLRMHFFEALFDAIQYRRVQPILRRIQDRKNLAPELPPAHVLRVGEGEALYENQVDRLGIQFQVERLACRPEVLDPRIVRIPPGKNNEKHKHAHETIFYVLEGSGRILIDEAVVPVKTGDCVFGPRWALHQAQNTGASDLVLLAVTDYGLTGKAFIGNYNKTARMQKEDKENREEGEDNVRTARAMAGGER